MLPPILCSSEVGKERERDNDSSPFTRKGTIASMICIRVELMDTCTSVCVPRLGSMSSFCRHDRVPRIEFHVRIERDDKSRYNIIICLFL